VPTQTFGHLASTSIACAQKKYIQFSIHLFSLAFIKSSLIPDTINLKGSATLSVEHIALA